MGKGEFSSLAPFTIPEALLRSALLLSLEKISSPYELFVDFSSYNADVGRAHSQG